MSTSALMPNYKPADLAFERGEGPWLYTTDGDAYLDFTSGIAVNTLGHADPRLVAAVEEQARKVWHVSNVFRIPEAEALAQKLVDLSFGDRAFFCNSGAEAIECGLKAMRRYFWAHGQPERNRVITFGNAFHGRTLGTIAAGGNPSYMEGFAPNLDGFDQVPFGDLDAVKAAIGPHTAGVLIEPVQGEGGVKAAPDGFLAALKALCAEEGLLLMFDEVQCGVARTGRLFAHEWDGVTPDIMALAKGLGGGFPIGACVLTDDVAQHMIPGTHGSTFGGNPLAMAVGLTVLNIVAEEDFLANVRRVSGYLSQKLGALQEAYPEHVAGLRGRGLLMGVQFTDAVSNADILLAARDAHMLIPRAGDNVVRLLPPLNIDESIADEAATRLEKAIHQVANA